MTDAPTEPLPIAGGPDPAHPVATATATCRSCSSPLAPDQRYCLGCGARVAPPRVDRAALAGAAGAGPATTQPAAAGGRGERWTAMLDRIGGPMGAAAVVLVALGVGYLLGQGGGEPSGPATIIQRSPIVNVQGGGTAPAGDASASGTSGDTASRRGAGKDAGGSTAGIPQAAPDDAGGDLNRLRAQPEQQATGGDAPRRDDKAAGGGTDAETIG